MPSDICVMFIGEMAFRPALRATDIELFYWFQWIPTAGGTEEKVGRAVSISITAQFPRWQHQILDDIRAWAAAHGHTIVRLVCAEFSTPVP